MQSKRSLFNRTVFCKNLIRFAPLWAFYTIAMLVWLMLSYSNTYFTPEITRLYGFAYRFGRDYTSGMSLFNMFYALAVALLLFGDLFNSRMCNALHAMPLSRAGWFVTNAGSGLVFCLIPSAAVALAAMALLSGSVYENAWSLAALWFVKINLEYICFFGIAAFSAMCTGNRFTMAAGYGLLNVGTYVAYWLVDTLYTPLLYGVVTPATLAERLSPVTHVYLYPYFQMERAEVLHLPQGTVLPEGTVLSFSLTEHWWRLPVLALVGVAFALAALALYQRRDLECAGDAVAFPSLVPVFQVLCAVFVMAAAQYFIWFFLGIGDLNYVILALSLTLGWFVGKMLLERSTRVFRLKNWTGLGFLALALAISLAATHFDVLGIARRLPDREAVRSVHFGSYVSFNEELTESGQIDDMIRFRALAVEDPVEDVGTYILDENGEYVRYTNQELPEGARKYQAGQIYLRYALENGSYMTRRYNVWADSEAGRIARSYLSRWERLADRNRSSDEDADPRSQVERVLADFQYMQVDLMDVSLTWTKEDALSFLEAVKADCAAGTMAQDHFFHRGVFTGTYTERNGEVTDWEYPYIYVSMGSTRESWSVEVYPDSENCIRWLREHGAMPYSIELD